MNDEQRTPRRCRWFGHKWHWPPSLRGVDCGDFGWFPTGGFDFYCERCEATKHVPGNMIADGFL